MERIGVVGVGRMGANMARRLKEVGYPVTAVFDVRADAAQKLAAGNRRGSLHANWRASRELADVIITVVTDDAAMKKIFARRRHLLKRAKGKLFINCATVTPAAHVGSRRMAKKKGAQSLEACMASSITQARRRHAVSHVRRQAGGVRARETDSGKTQLLDALRRPGRRSRARSRRSSTWS